jgi:GAF domain
MPQGWSGRESGRFVDRTIWNPLTDKPINPRESRRTLVVPDVGDFPGHIACDAASRSEIVVPLLRGGRPFGVLDLDSPSPSRFDDADADGLGAIDAELLACSDLTAFGESPCE